MEESAGFCSVSSMRPKNKSAGKMIWREIPARSVSIVTTRMSGYVDFAAPWPNRPAGPNMHAHNRIAAIRMRRRLPRLLLPGLVLPITAILPINYRNTLIGPKRLRRYPFSGRYVIHKS